MSLGRRHKEHVVVDILDRLWPHHATEKDKTEHLVECPFCVSDKKKCSVNPKKGVFKCWVCGEKGSIGKLLHHLHYLGHISQVDVKAVYDDTHGLGSMLRQVNLNGKKQHDEKPLWSAGMPCALPERFLPLSDWGTGTKAEREVFSRAIRYLEGRGFGEADVVESNLLLCVHPGTRYHGHILFPILDAHGRQMRFWTTRTVLGTIPKSFHSGKRYSCRGAQHVLFNEHLIQAGQPVAVCEGPFDAMSVTKHVVPAVALLGKVIHRYHLGVLRAQAPSRVYVCLDADADPDAEKVKQSIGAALSGVDVFVVRLDRGDPNDTDPQVLMDAFVDSVEHPRVGYWRPEPTSPASYFDARPK